MGRADASRDAFIVAEGVAGDVRRRAAALVAGVWILRGHGSSPAARAAMRAVGMEPFGVDAPGARDVIAGWPAATDEDADRLGVIYEAALAQDRRVLRRRTGVHYTPRALCESVTRSTLRGMSAAIDGGAEPLPARLPHVLDLAAGTAAFLLAARRAIVARWNLDLRGATAFTRHHLHGIDVDPCAILVARLALSIGTDAAPRDLDGLVAGDAIAGALDAPPWVDLFARTCGDAAPGGERGFDVVVSNPPYVGGKRIRTHFGEAYAARLAARTDPLSRNADLAAHFLRRGYEVLREGGVLGFVTTNTIAQGATRQAGLAHLVRAGARIFEARPRVPWPGDASVIATTLHVSKPRAGVAPPSCVLDGLAVDAISPLLTSTSTHGEPARIPGRTKLAFIGCFVRGMGFTFDDDNPAATPLAEMRRILAAHPDRAEVIRPYLGGAEISQDPAQRHHRHVISFADASLEEARQRWPELVDIVERRVRPYRERLRETAADRQHAKTWWRFANDRAEMRKATAGLSHVIVVPRVSPHVIAARVPTGPIFSDQLVVIASASHAMLGLMQSQLHALWAWRLSSTLGDGLRYTPRTAFETLVVPPEIEAVAGVARALDEARQDHLARHGIGLTDFYNRFHDRTCNDASIVALREAHVALDRAVLAAYAFDREVSFGFHPSEVEPRKRERFGLAGEDARRVLDHLFAANARAIRDAVLTRTAAGSDPRAAVSPGGSRRSRSPARPPRLASRARPPLA